MRILRYAFLCLLTGAGACGGGPDAGPGRNVLHLSIGADPASLDPIQAVDVYRGQMVVYLYDGLVRLENGKPVPNLAESWDVSEDGTVYTFHLRDDVFFHNGRQLTAEDVQYSFERVLRPASQSPLTWVFDFIRGADAMVDGGAESLEGVRVIDLGTIEITLEQPFAPFLLLMAMPAAHVVPREEIEQKGDQFSEAPVGTGPWTFES
jgi:oligopeptide transport system substrate-binding protein